MPRGERGRSAFRPDASCVSGSDSICRLEPDCGSKWAGYHRLQGKSRRGSARWLPREPGNVRGQATGNRLSLAALDVAERVGVHAATIDEICRLAGCSRRTPFHHFPSREAALLGSAVPTVKPESVARYLAEPVPILAGAIDLVDIPEEMSLAPPWAHAAMPCCPHHPNSWPRRASGWHPRRPPYSQLSPQSSRSYPASTAMTSPQRPKRSPLSRLPCGVHAHLARKRLAVRRAWRCLRSSEESRAVGAVGAGEGAGTGCCPIR